MAETPSVRTALPPGFVQVQEGNAVLIVKQELAEPVRRALSPLHQAWGRFAQRRFSARGRAGIVAFPLGPRLPTMLVRRYLHGGLFARIGRDLFWGWDRALMELAVAATARTGGVRTPEPLGVIAQPEFGPLWRMAYLSVEVTDSEDLVHYACRLAEYPEETAAVEKRGVLAEAARQIRQMHDLGITHGDLHLKNLLFQRQATGTPQVYVIDFDLARLGAPLNEEQRLGNLKRLARSVRKVRVADQVLTAWDRLRFLRAYVQGQPDARRLMRTWAKALASSGRSHEVWWTMTAAQRTLRGDRIGLARAVQRQGRR